MSNGNGPEQVRITVISAPQKALAHDLEVVVDQHVRRGEVSMVEAAGLVRHVATILDARVMQHHAVAQQAARGPRVVVAPAGFKARRQDREG